MANFVSPGTYVIEKDNSDYPVSINPSVVGIVGYASMGPANEATLITSQEQLVRTFGQPSEAVVGQGLEGSLEILETTNSLYYVRALDEATATDAFGRVAMGACPALEVSAGGFGVTADIHLDVQVAVAGVNQYATAKQFDIPAGTLAAGGTQAAALKKVIGGSLASDKFGAYYDDTTTDKGYLVAPLAGSGVELTVTAWDSAARTTGLEVLYPMMANGDASGTATSSVSWTGMSFPTLTSEDSIKYEVESIYAGEGYNYGLKSDGSVSGVTAEVIARGGDVATLQINRDGAAAETFSVSLVGAGAFIEDVVNTGEVDATSELIKGNLIHANADFNATALPEFTSKLDSIGVSSVGVGLEQGSLTATQHRPRFVKLIAGTTPLAGGDSGTDTSFAALIGDAAEKTGIHALDDDLLGIGLAAVPGITDQAAQNELITLAESSQNFLAVVAPPEGYNTVSQAIDWSNGQSDERTAAINSSYAAIYWPWVKVFDTFAAKDRYFDPAIYGIRQMCHTDEVGEPWFAPAGVVRGRLTKPTEVEVRLNQGDRDSMYSGGNAINPIVSFPQQGMMIFGQRTAQREPTSLDRINVRRLMIQVRKQVLASTRRFIFEPNDATTWEKLTNSVQPLLDDIRRRRGITDFKVICDETTNTPVRVDRNELWCKVLIKPTKSAEIVVIELNLTNQSAQF